MSIEIIDVPEKSRYEANVDGARAGFAAYRKEGGRVVFTHTEVDEAYGGQGVGGALARGALDDARAKGLSVVPECHFIKSWIDKHPDYADLVAA
ncbi:GNAT family N-acetyltransferase [Spirillospora sp. CA-294931]|uniref:GNAT family N-acetyltransferase n=1 Tax=Spirillospora sp. CA-294931 TaxID=3240042 RepID=UPI003D8F7920